MNSMIKPFGLETGQSRWWRFAQVVQFSRHSIGASGPDVAPNAKLTLINMHSPSSDRVGMFEGRAFKNTLKITTKMEYVRRCLLHTHPGPTILAGDTNIKQEVELVTLTTQGPNGQWGVQPNHLKQDDFIIFRGFRRRPQHRRLVKSFGDYSLKPHCPVWVNLLHEPLQQPLLSRDAAGLAVVRDAVIAHVADPNLPNKTRMTEEEASKHFDNVLAELAQKVRDHHARSQQIDEEFRAEAAQETAGVSSSSADAGPVGSSGAPGPAAADIPGEGTGEDDERTGEDELDWGGPAISASPEPPRSPSPAASPAPSPAPSRSRSRSRSPSRSPSPPPGTTHLTGRAQALRRAAVVVKVVSRACVVL